MPDRASIASSPPGRAAGAAEPSTLGRFVLRRRLGAGGQATVWLAFDPRLEREVAIKLLPPFSADRPQLVEDWLREARSVARLAHPRIVPLYEADLHEHRPYLVFEYAAGGSLADRLRTAGAFPPREAAALLLDLLEGLQAAHAAGLVHRDLKPANVLLDAAGRARVADFGLAAWSAAAAAHADTLVQSRSQALAGSGTTPQGGTPAYMAPETAAGADPTPAVDVFAAGLLLAELLGGRPLVDERDPMRALYRIVHEDLVLPAAWAPEADDALRAIVQRALARDPAQRYADAGAMRAALAAWAAPEDSAMAEGTHSATLEFLLRRMRHKSDFPALSDAVVRIQSVASSDTESVGSLTNEILKDVALTHKLLRLVNSVHYAHAGGGTVSTVSRAVSLVGFNAVRNMALGLVLLERMQDKSHAGRLKEEFLRSLMAGAVAGELSPAARDREEAFIGAMFQNLGRLLTEFYFPEEARQVRARLADPAHRGGEESAAAQVLGLGYEELGLGVARVWSLPDSLQRCMRKPRGAPPAGVPGAAGERVRWAALAANDIADALLHGDPQAVPPPARAVALRHARALDMTVQQVEEATQRARQRLIQLAQVMELQLPAASPALRLLADPGSEAAAAPDGLHAHALRAAPAPDAAGRAKTSDMLAAGVQDITNAMVEQFRLHDVLRMILETMYRALGFRRVVFCLRDARTDVLGGRLGLGDGHEQAARALRVPLKAESDLFAAVCRKGADTLISDATEPRMAARLPDWYRQSINAPAFLLLPLALKGAPFALIYADQATPGGIVLDDKELALLRTLRNQAVMAFRHGGQ